MIGDHDKWVRGRGTGIPRFQDFVPVERHTIEHLPRPPAKVCREQSAMELCRSSGQHRRFGGPFLQLQHESESLGIFRRIGTNIRDSEKHMREADTIIVGGGISGATALHRLAREGRDVLLLERTDRLGGTIVSERSSAGALIERGPNSLQSGNPVLDLLIDDLGLRDNIVVADKAAANRYVLRDGTLVPVPTNPKALIESSLISGRAKLRLMTEPFRSRRTSEEEESVADFVRRRLGREPLLYGINPFVSGIYAGRPEDLSLRHAFPMLYDLEHEHGSLIRGGMKRMKARRRASASGETTPPKRRMFSFRDGIASLTTAIADRWTDHIQTGTEATGLARDERGWSVSAVIDGEEREFRSRNLILATDAGTAARLTEGIDSDLATALRRIEYPPVAVVTILADRESVRHPLDGFGLLCPEVEGRNVLGVIFSSTIFPNRAPEGNVLLTTFVGGARQPDRALQPESEILASVTDELRELIGYNGNAREIDMAVWRRAIPQYNLGYGLILRGIGRAEERLAGLRLLGNYRGGVSVPDCIASGWGTAEKILEATG